jgi:hypothetical protein
LPEYTLGLGLKILSSRVILYKYFVNDISYHEYNFINAR